MHQDSLPRHERSTAYSSLRLFAATAPQNWEFPSKSMQNHLTGSLASLFSLWYNECIKVADGVGAPGHFRRGSLIVVATHSPCFRGEK
jgi:hypothetical protein